MTEHLELEEGPKVPEDFEAQEILEELQKRSRAKRGLLDFATYMDDMYESHAVHRLIAKKLEEVESGACRRLAIFIPPSSGKSELVSRFFPAWCVGRNPRTKFIHASYNADLSASFGRVIRDRIREPRFQNVFPGVSLAPEAMARDEWATTAGGTYKAEGVGGGLIGFHAHIAIVDDPTKDWEQASSATHREMLWNWYTSVLLNRLRPYKNGPGAVILIMQRWYDDDLGGRVKRQGEWDVLEVPSIATANDPLGRSEGEALLPAWRSLKELHAIRDENPIQFLALHQQQPVPNEGDIFDPEWFGEYDELPTNLTFYGASDYATSEDRGDYSVHIVGGCDSSGLIYFTDLFRAQCDTATWVDALLSLMRQRDMSVWAEEPGSILKGVGPFIKRRMQEENLYVTRRPLPSIASKISRAATFAGLAQTGKILFPKGAPWVGDFIDELVRFPRGKNDDMVDAGSLLCRLIVKINRGDGAAVAVKEEAPRNLTFDEMVNRRVLRARGIRMNKIAPFIPEPSYEQNVLNSQALAAEVFEELPT